MPVIHSNPQNDLNYVKQQLAPLKPMDVKELKVPLIQAQAATSHNNLDEVFVKYQGKDYVAYGKGLKMDELLITENHNLLGLIPAGKSYYDLNTISDLPVTGKQDERNTFGAGYRRAKMWERSNVSTPSAIGLGAGALAGIALGIAGGTSLPGKVIGAALAGLLGSGIGRIVGVQAYGLLEGSKSSHVTPDFKSIEAIVK